MGQQADRITRAIILTTQRTGSTFLVESLQSHADIACVTELLTGGHLDLPDFLYRWRLLTKGTRFVCSGAWYPQWLMARYFATGDKPVRIFKVMYNHIANPWARSYLLAHADIRILHLRRHNLLKMYVSKLLLSRKRENRWQPHATRPVPVLHAYVDPQAAILCMRKARALYKSHEELFAGHERLPLVYEEMIDRQQLSQQTATRICEFLGVPVRPLHSSLVKMNPDALQDMVINYDELAAAVSRTEFADLLG